MRSTQSSNIRPKADSPQSNRSFFSALCWRHWGERAAAPVEEAEDHLADRAVAQGYRRAGVRVDQFEQAVVGGDEVHAGTGFGRRVARDRVERVAAAGVVVDACAEPLRERAPDRRVAAAALAGAEEPAQPER